MRHIIGTVALVAILGCGGGEGAEDAPQPDLGTDIGPDASDPVLDRERFVDMASLRLR